MLCTACGSEAPDDATYCAKCGRPLSGQEEVERPAAKPSSSIAERLKGAVSASQDDEEEERDLWQGGYSGKAMIGTWLLCAVSSLLLIVATVFFPQAWVGLIPLIFVVWIIATLVLIYRKLSVHYALTSQRFIHKSGILRRATDRIEVIDIDDVTYTQGLVQRMVGVGSICISSSDSTHPKLVLLGIDDVKTVADQIDDVRRRERRRRGLHIEAV